MTLRWTLLLWAVGLARGDNLQHFMRLGASTSDKEACRKTDGTNPASIGAGGTYWQATGIATAEHCATLCLEVLDDCRGFEYQNMTGNSGRCELWMEDVIAETVSSFAGVLYCYNRTTRQAGTATAQYVSLTFNFTGLNTSTVNSTITDAMTSHAKTLFSTHLTGLADRPEVNISESDVSVVIMSCETAAVVITKPAGTNVLPIYEALSYFNSADNPNQGSKRAALRTAMNAGLAGFGISIPSTEHNPRAIGAIAGQPSGPTTCTATDDQITVSAARGWHVGAAALAGLVAYL